MKKFDLTIHSVVKNEPFFYYAIKAVYNYCDKILIYDTGSTDHTLADIQQLIQEDVGRKITFRQIPLGFDEEKWSLNGLQSFIDEHRGNLFARPAGLGKRCVCLCRRRRYLYNSAGRLDH